MTEDDKENESLKPEHIPEQQLLNHSDECLVESMCIGRQKRLKTRSPLFRAFCRALGDAHIIRRSTSASAGTMTALSH